MSLFKQLLIAICVFLVVAFSGGFFVSLESSRTQYVNQLRSHACLLYTSPSPRDQRGSRMPSSA